MVFLLLALFLVSLAGCTLLAASLASAASKRRHKRAWQAAHARWERLEAELRRGASPPGQHGERDKGSGSAAPIIMESLTLGWLNLLVQSMWAPVLERFVSSIAAERLQIILNEVLRKAGDRRPWKYIEHVSVEEVTFGLSPPQFQFANARFDPSRQVLQIQLNIKYNSSGFQAVLVPRVRQIGLLKAFSLRLQITQLLLSGRLSLGVQLSSEAPGVRGIEYSFLQEPEFEIQFSPVGMSGMAGELPGLISGLRSVLLKAMSKKVVEPNRRFLDVQKIYRNKYVHKAGGPGGMLAVTVVGARNVAPGSAGRGNSAEDREQASASAGDVDPFVEMRFGREVFRTPIVHDAQSPVWNWQLDVRLPAAIPAADHSSGIDDGGPGSSGGSKATATTTHHAAASAAAAAALSSAAAATSAPVLKDDRLRFTVLNAMTVGEPEVLSTCQVRLRDLGLTANGEAVPVLLPLKADKGTSHGSLQLQIRLLKHVPKISPFRAATPSTATRSGADASASSSPPHLAFNATPSQLASDAHPGLRSDAAGTTTASFPADAATSQHAPSHPPDPSHHGHHPRPHHPNGHLNHHHPTSGGHLSHHHPASGSPRNAPSAFSATAAAPPLSEQPSASDTTQSWLRWLTQKWASRGRGLVAAPALAHSSGSSTARGSPPSGPLPSPDNHRHRPLVGAPIPAASSDGGGPSLTSSPQHSTSSSLHQQPQQQHLHLRAAASGRLPPHLDPTDPTPLRPQQQQQQNRPHHRLRWAFGNRSSLHKRAASEVPASALEPPRPFSPLPLSPVLPPPPPPSQPHTNEPAAVSLEKAESTRADGDGLGTQQTPLVPWQPEVRESMDKLGGFSGGADAGEFQGFSGVPPATEVSSPLHARLTGPSTASDSPFGLAAAEQQEQQQQGWGATAAASTVQQSSTGPRDGVEKSTASTAGAAAPGGWVGRSGPLPAHSSMAPADSPREQGAATSTDQGPGQALSQWQDPDAKGWTAGGGPAKTLGNVRGTFVPPSLDTSVLPPSSRNGSLPTPSLSLSSALPSDDLSHAAGVGMFRNASSGTGQLPSPQGAARWLEASPSPWGMHLQGQHSTTRLQQGGPLAASDGGLDHEISVFQNLSQVVRIQALLDQERTLAHELAQQVALLRRRYKALVKLRTLENRRALMEGARFWLHGLAPNRRLRVVHVCYVEGSKALKVVEEGVGAGGGSGGGREPAATAAGMIPVSALAKVELGSALFPKASDGWGSRLSTLLQSFQRSRGDLMADHPQQSSGGGAPPASFSSAPDSAPPDMKCMTLVLASPGAMAEGSAGGGAVATGEGRLNKEASGGGGGVALGGAAWLQNASSLHLQVPDVGNGRSRDEWAHAFNDLIKSRVNQPLFNT